jgi:hypothetical protein
VERKKENNKKRKRKRKGVIGRKYSPTLPTLEMSVCPK